MTLDAQIEAILFFKAEPVTVSFLAGVLQCSEDEIQEALSLLQAKLAGRGIAPIFKDDEVTLATSPEAVGDRLHPRREFEFHSAKLALSRSCGTNIKRGREHRLFVPPDIRSSLSPRHHAH
ncbi:MAG: SMC-Scp complex subunit ScpB [Parcubacteria group bacterium]|nr:SMC-Scp complex subunit ScpB [Parcubacteria group bacterium]